MNNTVANDFFWISQAKVATVHRWGGQMYNLLMPNLTHQKSLKSVNFWQSYLQKKVDVFLGGTQCTYRTNWNTLQHEIASRYDNRKLSSENNQTTHQLTSAEWLQMLVEGMTGDRSGTASDSQLIRWSCPTAGLLNLLPVSRPANRHGRKTRAWELLRRSRGRPSTATQVLPELKGATALHADFLAAGVLWYTSTTWCCTHPT